MVIKYHTYEYITNITKKLLLHRSDLFWFSVLCEPPIKMPGYFKVKLFNLSPEEITFESFVQFSLKVFWLGFFNFNRKSSNETTMMRIYYYARIIFYIIGLFSIVTASVQLLTYDFIHSRNLADTANAIGNASSGALIFVKALITLWRKDDIPRNYGGVKRDFRFSRE